MLAFRALVTLWILLGQFITARADTNPTDFSNVVSSTFYSDSRNQEIRITVYTPPGYQGGDERYPVLYFLHGISGDHFLYWRAISREVRAARGDAGAWLNQLISNGTIPPLIVVTVNDEGGGWDAQNEVMVTEELIEFIDANWRTIPDRSRRAIEGFSMGGLGANRYAARNTDLYCSALVMSAPDIEPLAQPWEQNKTDVLGSKLGVFLAVGSNDQLEEGMTELHNSLTALQIPHEYVIARGPGHDFGKLYNAIGLEGLKFHTSCFARNEPPPDWEVPLPEKIFMPLLNRELRNHIPFD